MLGEVASWNCTERMAPVPVFLSGENDRLLALAAGEGRLLGVRAEPERGSQFSADCRTCKRGADLRAGILAAVQGLPSYRITVTSSSLPSPHPGQLLI